MYLAIPVQFFWASQAWYGMFIIFIPIYLFLLLPMRMILVGETEGFLKAVGTVHWGVMTTVFCLSHLAYLLILDNTRTPAGGAGLLLFVGFLTPSSTTWRSTYRASFWDATRSTPRSTRTKPSPAGPWWDSRPGGQPHLHRAAVL